MATRNDITGDLIQTKSNGNKDAYAENWEKIFGKKRLTPTSGDSGHSTDNQRDTPLVNEDKLASTETTPNQSVESTLCDICGKELNKVGECAWTSCPLNWDEKRTDIVGQNGNIGYGEDAS